MDSLGLHSFLLSDKILDLSKLKEFQTTRHLAKLGTFVFESSEEICIKIRKCCLLQCFKKPFRIVGTVTLHCT